MTTHPLSLATTNSKVKEKLASFLPSCPHTSKGPFATVLMLSSDPATLVSTLSMQFIILLEHVTPKNNLPQWSSSISKPFIMVWKPRRKLPEVGCFPGPLYPVTVFSPPNSGLHFPPIFPVVHPFVDPFPKNFNPGSECSGQALLPLKQPSLRTLIFLSLMLMISVTPLEGTSAREGN